MTTDRPAIDRRTAFEDLPDYLSPEECRAYLGISRSTMYDLVRRDVLPHRTFGRLIRIPKRAVRPSAVEVE